MKLSHWTIIFDWPGERLTELLLKRYPHVGEWVYLKTHVKVTNAPKFMAITEKDGKEYSDQFPIEMGEISFEDGKIIAHSRIEVSKCAQTVTGHYLDLKGLSSRHKHETRSIMEYGDTLQLTHDMDVVELQ